MRRLLTGLFLAAVLVGTAGAAQPERVLAVEWQAGGGTLRWVSPTTLRPVGPAMLNVGGAPANVAAVSPNGAVAALGGGADGRLRFVRLGSLRQEGLLSLGEGSVFRGVWATPRRLVLLLGGARPQVVTIDPTVRKVLRREQLAGTVMRATAADGRVLTLLAQTSGVGPVQLAVIGGDGSVRTVKIPGITAGVTAPATPEGVARIASPALAAHGSRAAVLGRESLVDVDLATLAVREQRLETRTTARALKRVEGWGRNMVWLRGSSIAYSGWSADGEKQTTLGVWVADIDTGATRVLDAKASSMQRAGSTLLVHGSGPLRGYELDGALRYELLGDSDTGYVQIAGRYAYVGSGNSTRFDVVDVEAGRIVGLARTSKPTVVLAPSW
jgi:hypothetical protein